MRLHISQRLGSGGGLVSGDSIDLSIRLDPSCHLVLLTQGNTKVLRERPGGSYHSLGDDGLVGTYQKMVVDVEPNASVFLLPAPVTCFEKSIYSQHQIFNLSSSSSLLLLDWFTSGRHSRGEKWAFERYRSQNEVHIDGKKLANDVLLLEGRDIHARMSKYSCYCTMVLCGPALASILDHFVKLSAELRQYKRTEPQDLIWSFSELMTQGGEGAVSAGIVRCAGIETEMVKDWVEKQLAGLKDIVGTDMYRAAFV